MVQCHDVVANWMAPSPWECPWRRSRPALRFAWARRRVSRRTLPPYPPFPETTTDVVVAQQNCPVYAHLLHSPSGWWRPKALAGKAWRRSSTLLCSASLQWVRILSTCLTVLEHNRAGIHFDFDSVAIHLALHSGSHCSGQHCSCASHHQRGFVRT